MGPVEALASAAGAGAAFLLNQPEIVLLTEFTLELKLSLIRS
jgi:hypothetical protein